MLRSHDDWETVCTLEGHRGWERLRRHLIEELEASRNQLEDQLNSDTMTNHLRGQIFILKKVTGIISEAKKALMRMNQDRRTPAQEPGTPSS